MYSDFAAANNMALSTDASSTILPPSLARVAPFLVFHSPLNGHRNYIRYHFIALTLSSAHARLRLDFQAIGKERDQFSSEGKSTSISSLERVIIT